MRYAISDFTGCPLKGFQTVSDLERQKVESSAKVVLEKAAALNLEALGVDPAKAVVVTRDDVKYAKPDPDLFIAAAGRLGVPV